MEFILSNLAHHDLYWTQTYDCYGKLFIAPAVKFLAAQKMLCCGISLSNFQYYFQMSDRTAQECVSKMTRDVVKCPAIADIYLRSMTQSDAKRVAEIRKAQHGVDIMLGSLYITKIHWGNCPWMERPVPRQGRTCSVPSSHSHTNYKD